VKKGDCKDCGSEAGACLFCSDVTHNGFEPKEKSGEGKVKFDNDVAVQKAMRHFSSAELAKVVLHDPETKDALKRNMNETCWGIIQEYLDNYEFCETPEETLNRFVKEYRAAEEAEREKGN
jgi:hypothetical protein